MKKTAMIVLVALLGLIQTAEGARLDAARHHHRHGGHHHFQSMAQGEPPQAPIMKTDQDVETSKEGEERAIDIANAKNVKMKSDADVAEAAKKSAEQLQAEKEAAWKANTPLSDDGLQHWPDGRNWYTPDN